MNAIEKSQFLALYCMVLADGIITADELTCLYKIGKDGYDLTDSEINKAVTEVGSSFVLLETLESKVTLLYYLGEIAWADGKIDNTEKDLLAKYARVMGFADENIDDIVEYMLQQAHDKKPLNDVLAEILSKDHE